MKVKGNPILFFICCISLSFNLIFSFWFFKPGHVRVNHTELMEFIQLTQSNKLNEISLFQDFLKENYSGTVEEDAFFLGMLRGSVEALNDPYSYYMTQEEYEAFLSLFKGSFSAVGIGVDLLPNAQNQIEVVAVHEGSSAADSGIQKGDHIVEVDGISYDGHSFYKATHAMLGQEGDWLSIGVRSQGQGPIIPLRLMRKPYEKVALYYELLEDHIALITIKSFYEGLTDDFFAIVENELPQSVSHLILDLRDNPGGYMEEGYRMADFFLEEGLELGSMVQKGEKEIFKATSFYHSMPLVILINEGSASASELFAAALQEHRRAQIVGAPSYGKGSVQEMIPFQMKYPANVTDAEEHYVILSTATFYGPNGKNIHKSGLEPDIWVPERADQLKGALEMIER